MTRLGFSLLAGSVFSLSLSATVAVVAFGLPIGGPPSEPREQGGPPTPVRVETVHLQPAGRTARYAAALAPRIETTLAFRVGGKIVERLVDAGARVERGTVLARLDTADLTLQLRQVEARLAAARATAANARGDFTRYASLTSGGWSTRQEFDRRRSIAESADASVSQLEAELRLARDNLGYAALIADAPGIVTGVLAEPGQVVSEGQGVFKMAHSDELEAVADLPEQALAELANADLAVELWANPGRAVAGKLREVAPSADPVTRTFRVKIALPAPPPGAAMGMTATLLAQSHDDRTVALAPLAAVTKDEAEPAVFVFDRASGKLSLRKVHVAAYAADKAIISDGLAEGDVIVTAGVHKLLPGQKVRTWSEPVR